MRELGVCVRSELLLVVEEVLWLWLLGLLEGEVLLMMLSSSNYPSPLPLQSSPPSGFSSPALATGAFS